MARQLTKRCLLYTSATLAGAFMTCALLSAQEIVRMSQNIPGDSAPLILNADEITTWIQGGDRVILLKGTVLVEQGVVHARMQDAAAWVNLERTRQTGIMHVDMYAEGNVSLENGPWTQQCLKAVLDLNTRGALKLNAHQRRVIQMPQPDDPLYQRARAERARATPPHPARELQRTSATEVPPAPPGRLIAPLPGPLPAGPSPAGNIMTPSRPPAPGEGAMLTLPAREPLPGVFGPTTPPSPPVPLPGDSQPPGPAASRKGARRSWYSSALARAVPDEPIPGVFGPSEPAPAPSAPAPPASVYGPASPMAPAAPEPIPGVFGPPAPGGTSAGPPPANVYGPPPSPPSSVPPGIEPTPGVFGPPGAVGPPAIAAPLPPIVPPAPAGPGAPEPASGVFGPPSGTAATVPPPATGPRAPATAAAVPASPRPVRQFRIVPRTQAGYQEQTVPLPNGEQALIVTGGVILTVRGAENVGLLDIEADRLVAWSRGGFQQMFSNRRQNPDQASKDLEFYLAGNVEIREQNGLESRKLAADEVYYDVSRNVAVAYHADLEFKQPGLPDPVHMSAERMEQLSPTQFRAVRAEVFSSRLPSDPGLKLYVAEATLDEKRVPKRTIFGTQYVDRRTGQPETQEQRIFHGTNVLLEVEDTPIFYLPFIQGDANDPLGPLRNLRVNYNRVFGAQILTTFNVYDLIGIDPIPGTRWDFDADYLSARGPALGTQYDYAGKDLFGVPGKYNGLVKAYGIFDTGNDVLGRLTTESHPDDRGRFLWRQRWELPLDFTLQFQVSALSDKNFLEQYYKDEFDRDVNQETYVYLKQQRNDWAYTVLVEPRIRDWVTESERLPQVDGYLIGQTFDFPFLDRLTYNVHGSAGYDRLRPTELPPPPVEPTDVADSTGRFDLAQELSLPFYLGPVRLVPYLTADLAYYTQDLTGTARGRLYEGGGLRASIPFTRVYPDVQSDLWNLNGINHKIVLSGNYYNAHSDTPFSRLPQIDRLNDDATDQSLRDIKPLEPLFNSKTGLLLATSPIYDPQLYAIRRLVEDRIDTLDTIEVFQADIRQRLQTKRGYPENQHIVDWMTLDLSGSFFPHSHRDNFGENLGFLEYNYLWNIGDRTAFESTGWFDPVDNGARVFTLGVYLNRPDRTSFYIGYRQTEPLMSELVTGSVTYIFSPKYGMTATSSYDFGTQYKSLVESVVFTRMGSDLQLSLGVTYNSFTSNFGVIFEIVPNLLPSTQRVAGVPAFGSGTLGR